MSVPRTTIVKPKLSFRSSPCHNYETEPNVTKTKITIHEQNNTRDIRERTRRNGEIACPGEVDIPCFEFGTRHEHLVKFGMLT